MIFSFEPLNASIRVGRDATSNPLPTVHIDLRLAQRHSVRTKEDRLLNEIDWSIEIHRGDVSNEHVESCKAVGVLSHHPAITSIDFSTDEGAFAWSCLDDASFDLLSDLVLAGKLPKMVQMHVKGPGIEFGWEPDGSGKVWDLEKGASLYIERLELSLSHVERSLEEGHSDEFVHQVASSDLQAAQRDHISALQGMAMQINSRLAYILGLAAVAVLLLLFR